MPSEPVCIGKAYADGEYMRMYELCRCQTYGYATPILTSYFFRWDPISGGSGSASAPPARSGQETQYVAVFAANDDAICCVPPLPRDRPLTTLKELCGYSLTVVHFRKVMNRL